MNKSFSKINKKISIYGTGSMGVVTIRAVQFT